MNGPKPRKLYAEMGVDFERGDTMGMDVVHVFFGDELIITLDPIRESKAGHGDDSSYFYAEEEAIVAETVAPLLRRLFEQALKETKDD